MLISFLVVSILLGMLLTFVWSSSNWPNLLIKLCLACYTIWAVVLFLYAVKPYVEATGMRLM